MRSFWFSLSKYFVILTGLIALCTPFGQALLRQEKAIHVPPNHLFQSVEETVVEKPNLRAIPGNIGLFSRKILSNLKRAVIPVQTRSQVSPFEPHVAPHAWFPTEYFDGWFFRLTDHENSASFCIILGSMRKLGQKNDKSEGYCSHYIDITYVGSDEKIISYRFFPSGDNVSVVTDKDRKDESYTPSFKWIAKDIGELIITPESGSLCFKLEGLEIKANFCGRTPWSRDAPNSAGPEGWLGSTKLLPLHYFVHSFASKTEYAVKIHGSKVKTGSGLLHMECNYGDKFPNGWVWAQGCSNWSRTTSLQVSNKESSGLKDVAFVLTGGNFKIGPILTLAWTIGVRWDKNEWNFRSTDFDKVKVKCLSFKERCLKFSVTSRNGRRKIEMEIVAPEGSFGPNLYIPTRKGWSNKPGCVESHVSNATIKCFTRKRRFFSEFDEILNAEVPLSVLEFGAEYQNL